MWFRRHEPKIPPEDYYQWQLYRKGCGVAVLDMVLEKSYQEVLSSIRPKVDFDRQDMKLDFFVNYLFDYGFAVIARDRPGRDEHRAWPPAPWTAKHVPLVKKHWWHQLHLALMVGDGRVLDPHYGEVNMDFYWRIHAVIGVYQVEPPHRVP